MNKTKLCKKCGQESPLTNIYFGIRKDSKDGFENTCRDCRNKARRKNYKGKGKDSKRRPWTQEEIDIIYKYYENYSNEYIIENFNINRTSSQIGDYANKKLGLKKSKIINKDRITNNKNSNTINKNENGITTNNSIKKDNIKESLWKEDEIKLLIDNYGTQSNDYLSKNILKNKTSIQIRAKANHMGLYKNEDIAYKIRVENGRRNTSDKYDKNMVLCSICEKEIIRRKSLVLKNKKGFYCSKDCLKIAQKEWNNGEHNPNYNNGSAWTEDMRNKLREISTIRIGEMNNITNTKPQRILNELLNDMNILFENEYNCKYYSIDNYLCDYNLMIEVQGNFFHCNPVIGLKNNRKEKIINKDKRKNIYIKNKYNIEVLYLWEFDLLNNINVCKKLIKEYICSNGHLQNYHSFNYSIKDNILNINKNIIEMGY